MPILQFLLVYMQSLDRLTVGLYSKIIEFLHCYVQLYELPSERRGTPPNFHNVEPIESPTSRLNDHYLEFVCDLHRIMKKKFLIHYIFSGNQDWVWCRSSLVPFWENTLNRLTDRWMMGRFDEWFFYLSFIDEPMIPFLPVDGRFLIHWMNG